MKSFGIQKTTVATLLAVAFAAPAMADVTIYGFISASVESVKATGGATEFKSRTRVSDQGSRIGFKGNEDLGNGLKAIWQVEQGLRSFENGGTNDKGETAVFGTRNSFVGLQSAAYGKVLLGNNDSAYKALTDVGQTVMPNTTADAGDFFNRGDARLKNSVHYFSPNLSGLELGASYGVDEARTVGTTDGFRQNNDRLSLAAKYTVGAFAVAAGFDRQGDKLNTAGTTKDLDNTDHYKLVASYKLPTNTALTAGVEQVRKDFETASDTKQTGWTVGLSQPFGATTLKLQYAEQGKLDGVGSTEDDYKAKQWVIGATHDLSKRTQLFAYATKINNNKAAKNNLGIAPVYTSGLGTSTAALAAGNDPQAIGVGMKHSF